MTSALNKPMVLELGGRELTVGSPASIGLWSLWCIAFVVVLGMADVFFGTIITGLEEADRHWLEGDALSYYHIAIGEQSVLEREPLHPMILRGSIHLFGHPEPTTPRQHSENHLLVRHTSAWVGLVMIGMIGVLATRVAGRFAGIAAMTVYSVSVYPLYFAITGLRQTTMGVLALGLIWFFILRVQSKPAKVFRWTGLALCAAALPLVRMSSLAVVPMIATCYVALGFAWRRGTEGWKRRIMEAGIVAAVAWVAASPFLVACKVHRGRFFSVMVPHAKYYRNQEFAGQPGYPTAQEVADDPYTGDDLTPGQYILGHHDVPEIAHRYVLGYWKSFTKHLGPTFAASIGDDTTLVWWKVVPYWFWPLGVVVCFWGWRRPMLVVPAMFIVQFPFAFIVPLNVHLPGGAVLGVGYRFSMSMAPLMAVLIGAGLSAPLHVAVWGVGKAASQDEKNRDEKKKKTAKNKRRR
ncbi:MAG: hypothetical protein ACOCXX_00455 [Planctomycetota bacterium]